VRILARPGVSVVIGDEAIRQVAAGRADAVGKQVQAMLAGLPGAAPVAGAPAAASQSSRYGAVFRAEIIKWLEKFAPAPSLEGKGTGFDELLGAGGPEATGKTQWNYTTCNDTTIQIFAKAAQATNKQAGLTVKQVASISTRRRIGIVNRASDFGAPDIAKAIPGAWIDAAGGGRPEKGDLLLMTGKKSVSGYPEHIGFYYDYATSKSDKSKPPAEGADVWMTIDGGQGTKGTWTTPHDASSYMAGTGHESILKRERWHLPDGTIEGEPNQPARRPSASAPASGVVERACVTRRD
jgi:hypothetical protein